LSRHNAVFSQLLKRVPRHEFEALAMRAGYAEIADKIKAAAANKKGLFGLF